MGFAGAAVGAATDTVGLAGAAVGARVGAAGLEAAVGWTAGAAGAVGFAAAEVGAAVATARAVGCACVVLALLVAEDAGAFPPSTRDAAGGAPPVPTMIVVRAGR